MIERNKGAAGDWTIFYLLVATGEKGCVSVYGADSLKDALKEGVASITALELFDPSVKVDYEIVAVIRNGVTLAEYYHGGSTGR